jgi:hypothetical protein
MRALLLSCFFAGLVFQSAGLGADESPVLKMEGVKRAYSLKDSVVVKITNTSSRPVVFGIGVLDRDKDGWQEFLTNIEDREIARKAFRLDTIAPHSSRVFTWSPARVDKPPHEVYPGSYRIYLAYQDAHGAFGDNLSYNIGGMVPKHSKQLLFSDPFELRP